MLVHYDPTFPAILEPLDVALALSDIGVGLRTARVLCLLGAGASTAAGIQDFRGVTGLYNDGRVAACANQRLPPQQARAMFSASVYNHPTSRSTHWVFMAALKDQIDAVTEGRLECDAAEPVTKLHGFLKLLKGRGQLQRVYTQNIDGLEGVEGLSFVHLPGASPEPSSSDIKGKRRAQVDGDVEETNPGPVGDCVQLHGSLRAVRCTACPWIGDWRPEHSRAFARGKTFDCPSCQAVAADRRKKAKRTTTLRSYIRPALLLYDEYSAAAKTISSIAQHDLAASPTFLLVCGSTLKIPGFKSLVKRFSAEVRRNGGLAVFVNREGVGSEWDDVFDYQVISDCDAFVDRIMKDWGCEPFIPPASPSPSPASSPLHPLTQANLSTALQYTDPRRKFVPAPSPRRASPSWPASSDCSTPASRVPSSVFDEDEQHHFALSSPATSQSPPPRVEFRLERKRKMLCDAR